MAPKIDQNGSQNRCKTHPQKVHRKSTQNDPKMEPKWSPKWSQNASQAPLGAAMAPIGAPDPQNGAKMEPRTPKMDPKWSQNAPLELHFHSFLRCLEVVFPIEFESCCVCFALHARWSLASGLWPLASGPRRDARSVNNARGSTPA